MIAIESQDRHSEPCLVTHDLQSQGIATDEFIVRLLRRTSEENIRSKAAAVQDHAGRFSTTPIGKSEAIRLFHTRGTSVWIALHSIERDAELNGVFLQMARAVETSLTPPLNKILYCTGAMMISTGAATTPYHMDFGNNLLLHLRGHKRFQAYSPTDRHIVTEEILEEFFYTRNSLPSSMKYSKEFDRTATIVNFEPGIGIYMPSTSPHLTTTEEETDVSISISLSFVNPAAQRLRRASIMNYRYPKMKYVLPDDIKNAVMRVYERLNVLRDPQYRPIHESFIPRRCLNNGSAVEKYRARASIDRPLGGPTHRGLIFGNRR